MGRWNRRYYMPRRKNYKYQDPDWSPPCETYTDPEFGVWQDNVPMWEKKFCYYVGSVPWEKVLGAKTFMQCHSDILQWDDSAGEEAFCSAKERYWANINGLACDIALPDPDVYIDNIDWNAKIDPELVRNLDREYFAPVEDDGRAPYKNGCSSTLIIDSNTDINPEVIRNLHGENYAFDPNHGWAEDGPEIKSGNALHGNGCLQRDDNHRWGGDKVAAPMSGVSSNPWEQNATPIGRSNGWGDPWEQNNMPVGRSNGWEDPWEENVMPAEISNEFNNSWELASNSASKAVKTGAWGDETSGWGPNYNSGWQDKPVSSWVQKPSTRDTPNNWSSVGNSWDHERSGARRWQDSSKRRPSNSYKPSYHNSYKPQQNCFRKNSGTSKDAGDPWAQKQWGRNGYMDNGRTVVSHGLAEVNGVCRKREYSDNYMTVHKGPKVQGPDHQTGRHWRRKQVSFATQ